MNRLRLSGPIIGILCIIFMPVVNAETASLSGKSYSLLMQESSIVVQGELYTLLFTTYDNNRNSLPYFYDSSTGTVFVSRELKKIGSEYKADYYALLPGVIDDYGELSLSLGNIDFNNNGIDDISEIDSSVNIQISGNWYSFTGASGAITGSFIRNTGARQGMYNLSVNDTGIGSLVFSGVFYIGTVSGSVDYSASNKTVSITYTATLDTTSSPVTINTTYDVIDENTIRVYAMDILPETVFNRSGSTYTAVVTLLDGGQDTFWPDYEKWQVQIVDNNDLDKDGIPDLSDTTNDLENTFLPFLPLLLE